jgi:hypothetical protein
MLGRTPFLKPPDALVDRAQSVLESAGYVSPPADVFWAFALDSDYLRYLKNGGALARTDPYGAGLPTVYYFYYRSSPHVLDPLGALSNVTADNPPLSVAGMTYVTFDPAGRLQTFRAIPPQLESGESAPGDVNWAPFFAAASLSPSAFREVSPQWTPPSFADRRIAWQGSLPEHPEIPIRIEAASYRGRAVSFEIIPPWKHPERQQEVPITRAARLFTIASEVGFVALLALAASVAHRNRRLGRGDYRGARRLAVFAASADMLLWVLERSHVWNTTSELQRLFESLGQAALVGGMLGLFYLALRTLGTSILA